MIKTTLITQPLSLNQRCAMIVLSDEKRPVMATEVALRMRRRFGRKFGQVSILLTSLICRGLVKRCRVRGDVFYSRTGVQW